MSEVPADRIPILPPVRCLALRLALTRIVVLLFPNSTCKFFFFKALQIFDRSSLRILLTTTFPFILTADNTILTISLDCLPSPRTTSGTPFRKSLPTSNLARLSPTCSIEWIEICLCTSSRASSPFANFSKIVFKSIPSITIRSIRIKI